MLFIEKWLEAVDKKNSVLCAGLDPAVYEMGRGEKGLPGGIDKRDWALRYIEAVAPFCATVKPNFQYWKNKGDVETLIEIGELAHDLEMVVIDDSKLADIGSTNDAGFFYATQRADAVTYSPFAGNIAEATQQAEDRSIGIIGMCLMSNPEYKREKNKWVDVTDTMDKQPYSSFDITYINDVPHVKQYIYLARNVTTHGLDGIVIGAPSPANHIIEKEIDDVRRYSHDDTLVLLPGIGAQGGEADIIWKYFAKDRVVPNVGRSLMLPNGSNSTPQEQAETAKEYQEMLNSLRK